MLISFLDLPLLSSSPDDSEVEQKIRLQEVASGILSPEAYLEWRYGATGTQLEDLIPKTDESFEDVEDEVTSTLR